MPKALKSCPKSNKSPNLATRVICNVGTSRQFCSVETVSNSNRSITIWDCINFMQGFNLCTADTGVRFFAEIQPCRSVPAWSGIWQNICIFNFFVCRLLSNPGNDPSSLLLSAWHFQCQLRRSIRQAKKFSFK